MRALVPPVLTVLLSAVAYAQDMDELYGKAPKPGSAFVRLLNATDVPASTTIVGLDFGKIASLDATPYVAVAKGSHPVLSGSSSLDVQTESDQWYTAFLSSGGIRVIQDTKEDNLAKALIRVYNFSDAPVDLKTADGAVTVVAGIAPEATMGSKAVNPVAAELALFADSQALGTFDGLSLAAGSTYSAVAGAGDQTRWIEDTMVVPK